MISEAYAKHGALSVAEIKDRAERAYNSPFERELRAKAAAAKEAKRLKLVETGKAIVAKSASIRREPQYRIEADAGLLAAEAKLGELKAAMPVAQLRLDEAEARAADAKEELIRIQARGHLGDADKKAVASAKGKSNAAAASVETAREEVAALAEAASLQSDAVRDLRDADRKRAKALLEPAQRAAIARIVETMREYYEACAVLHDVEGEARRYGVPLRDSAPGTLRPCDRGVRADSVNQPVQMYLAALERSRFDCSKFVVSR